MSYKSYCSYILHSFTTRKPRICHLYCSLFSQYTKLRVCCNSSPMYQVYQFVPCSWKQASFENLNNICNENTSNRVYIHIFVYVSTFKTLLHQYVWTILTSIKLFYGLCLLFLWADCTNKANTRANHFIFLSPNTCPFTSSSRNVFSICICISICILYFHN